MRQSIPVARIDDSHLTKAKGWEKIIVAKLMCSPGPAGHVPALVAGFVFLVPLLVPDPNHGANQLHQRGIGAPLPRGVNHSMLWFEHPEIIGYFQLSGMFFVESPGFLDDHALLHATAARFVCDLLRDIRHDFRVNLPGPGTGTAATPLFRRAGDEPLPFSSLIRLGQCLGAGVFGARLEAPEID